MQVDDFDAAPMPLQVLGEEAAMAAVGGVLAAQQAGVGDYTLRDGGLDEAALDHGLVLRHVLVPGDLLLAVAVQQRVGGRQPGASVRSPYRTVRAGTRPGRSFWRTRPGPEVLRRRMSITRFAPDSRSRPKNWAADFLVKPMV